MKDRVRFTSRAYSKVILHGRKYSRDAVNGFLLAEAATTAKKSKNLVIVDAIPMFHLCLNGLPIPESILSEVDEVIRFQGLRIAGYYVANVTDPCMEQPAHMIANKIIENFDSAVTLVANCQFMGPNLGANLMMKVFHYVDNVWKPKERSKINFDGEMIFIVNSLIELKQFEELTDFDDHLIHIEKDWRNLHLNHCIEQTVRALNHISRNMHSFPEHGRQKKCKPRNDK